MWESHRRILCLSLYSISAEIITNDLRCIHQFTNFSGCQAGAWQPVYFLFSSLSSTPFSSFILLFIFLYFLFSFLTAATVCRFFLCQLFDLL
jgi:hypothetical protein